MRTPEAIELEVDEIVRNSTWPPTHAEVKAIVMGCVRLALEESEEEIERLNGKLKSRYALAQDEAVAEIAALREELEMLKISFAQCDKERLEALELCKPQYSREAAFADGFNDGLEKAFEWLWNNWPDDIHESIISTGPSKSELKAKFDEALKVKT
jgi:hypothetical protein